MSAPAPIAVKVRVRQVAGAEVDRNRPQHLDLHQRALMRTTATMSSVMVTWITPFRQEVPDRVFSISAILSRGGRASSAASRARARGDAGHQGGFSREDEGPGRRVVPFGPDAAH